MFRRFMLGDTDSEVIFHLFLSKLALHVELHRRGTPVEAAMDALQATLDEVREVADRNGQRCLLTLMVTDGELMVATHGGKELHWSTHKSRCAERNACPHFSAECEAPTPTGYVNHLIVSSEPLQGDNVWHSMREGEYVAVDHAMRLFHRPAA